MKSCSRKSYDPGVFELGELDGELVSLRKAGRIRKTAKPKARTKRRAFSRSDEYCRQVEFA
ncbi:MAG: hypothetical protein PHI35_01705 [Victivallaceae bacterium]|nr:hypothetical protein [Victivallaceae bacterium]